MVIIQPNDYKSIYNKTFKKDGQDSIEIKDHLGGFNVNGQNKLLNILFNYYKFKSVYCGNIIDSSLKETYPNLKFKLSSHCLYRTDNLSPGINNLNNLNRFTNLVCSFNGSSHVSRVLLVSSLQKFGYYNSLTCTKNFSFTQSQVQGQVSSFVDNDAYLMYFDHSPEFCNRIDSISYTRFDHNHNINVLTPLINNSFVHIVSETLATGGYPFITEKCLYSIVNHGLFLTYGPPGWHKHVTDFVGFKLYDTIFDYDFDTELNPVYRLIKILSMISRFKNLSKYDRSDLYELEVENIKYNFDHYMSGDYKRYMSKFSEI